MAAFPVLDMAKAVVQEAAKKKARMERFGIATGAKVSSSHLEEKKAGRVELFDKKPAEASPSAPLSEAEAKRKVENTLLPTTHESACKGDAKKALQAMMLCSGCEPMLRKNVSGAGILGSRCLRPGQMGGTIHPK